jgi:hypothetical protein
MQPPWRALPLALTHTLGWYLSGRGTLARHLYLGSYPPGRVLSLPHTCTSDYTLSGRASPWPHTCTSDRTSQGRRRPSRTPVPLIVTSQEGTHPCPHTHTRVVCAGGTSPPSAWWPAPDEAPTPAASNLGSAPSPSDVSSQICKRNGLEHDFPSVGPWLCTARYRSSRCLSRVRGKDHS